MPVRKIPISHNSVTGRHALGPGKRSVGFESTLERDFVSLMAFDLDVTNIEEQPVCINYADDEGRKHRYTPDYLVHRHNAQPLLAEIKPKKFLTPDLEPKFTAAHQYATARGWAFEVWTEREIRTPRLKSIQFLLPYRHRPADAGRMACIQNHLDLYAPMNIDELLDTCWNDETERSYGLSALWHLIAIGQVETDLNQELTHQNILSMSKEVSCLTN